MTTVTFRKVSLTVAGTAFLVLGTVPNPAAAVITTFNSSDFGAALSQPKTNLAAADFDAVASAVGITNLIDFETVVLGAFSSLSVAPGVTATLINNDKGGISSEQTITYGFNTTIGGSQFLQVRPTFGISTASLNFDFTEPIQGFGTYITGLGTAAGEMKVIFNNSTTQQLIVRGNPFGGSQFWGFIAPETLIRNISLSLSGITSLSRDIFGFDDIRYITTCSMQQSPDN